MPVDKKIKKMWKNRETIGDTNKSREIAAFLPDGLEIQESPPNPLARWLARALLALIVLGVLWACLGKINVIASAEGKIIPGSRVKQIQPLEKGVVKAILVNEGDYVEKGQALVELDATLTSADKERLESELLNLRRRLTSSQALLDLLNTPADQKVDINDIDIVLDDKATRAHHEEYKQLLQQQWLQFYAQLQSLNSALNKTRAEKAATQAVIVKLEQTLPIATQRSEKFKSLKHKQAISEMEYLSIEQERIQQFQDLKAERQRLKQVAAAESEVKENINLHQAQTKATLLSQIAEQKELIVSLEEETKKARSMNARQTLYAPASGRVQELITNTVGGVVTDAQQLMLIVPDEEKLDVEVFLENKDIGFVDESMSAEIKIHTFPFTKYGMINARIDSISDDATVDEQRGLIYRMQLNMLSDTLLVNGKEIKLMPGMAVTAEIQTGTRKIIEFFLDPLLRKANESIRER